MKLLITGAKGQLGSELKRQLDAGKSALGDIPAALHNAEVYYADIEEFDIANLQETSTFISHLSPDVVINCAAFTNVDLCETEQDLAFKVNALGPRNLAIACQKTRAKLVHLSTDYVFDGNAELPYSEDYMPAPDTVYGRTKLLGENYIKEFCDKWFIVRTAWLYSMFGNNFVKTILRLSEKNGHIKVVDDQYGTPTNAEDLAHHLLKLLVTSEFGLYHCTGKGICTWYEFACAIVDNTKTVCEVEPCTTKEFPRPAPRPAFSALEHSMLRATIGDDMRSWEDALKDFFTELENS